MTGIQTGTDRGRETERRRETGIEIETETEIGIEIGTESETDRDKRDPPSRDQRSERYSFENSVSSWVTYIFLPEPGYILTPLRLPSAKALPHPL